MPTILLVGEDENLQQIRAALLRTIGAKTACCSGSKAMSMQECQHCELVVLCHSLSEERKSALAQNVRMRWPEAQVLLVTQTKAQEQSACDAGVNAVCSMDPYALLRQATELLERRKSSLGEDPDPNNRTAAKPTD
jgi:DNA-binding response OmpR family regulator